jgi:hypothetical protein
MGRKRKVDILADEIARRWDELTALPLKKSRAGVLNADETTYGRAEKLAQERLRQSGQPYRPETPRPPPHLSINPFLPPSEREVERWIGECEDYLTLHPPWTGREPHPA